MSYVTMDGAQAQASFPDLYPKQSLLYADALGNAAAIPLLDGEFPLGVTGSPPVAGSFTGTNVTITPAANQINISIPQSVATNANPILNSVTPLLDSVGSMGGAIKRWLYGFFINIQTTFLTVTTMISVPKLFLYGASNQLQILPNNFGHSTYVTAGSPTTDVVINIRDPGGNADMTLSTDFDQLAQLKSNGNPTFNNLTLTGTFHPTSYDDTLVPDADATYDIGTSLARWRNIYVSGTVDGRTIHTDGSNLDTLVALLAGVSSAEVTQIKNIGVLTISSTNWGRLSALDQALTTGATVQFNNITIAAIPYNRILVQDSGTGYVAALTALTDGQIYIGSSGAKPVAASITSTGGTVVITLGAGTINLESAGNVGSVTNANGTNVSLVAGVLACSMLQDLSTSGTPSFSTLRLTSATNSTDFKGTSGALGILGGISVVKDAYFGADTYFNGSSTFKASQFSATIPCIQFDTQDFYGYDKSVNQHLWYIANNPIFGITATQVIVVLGTQFASNDDTDTSSGTTGSIKTRGGIGCEKSIYAGTGITSAGAIAAGTNSMTCGALSCTSLTSSGSISCGTNSSTCGTLNLAKAVLSNTSNAHTTSVVSAVVTADRTYTIPDTGNATDKFVMLGASQTFSGTNTFSNGATFGGAISAGEVDAGTGFVSNYPVFTQSVLPNGGAATSLTSANCQRSLGIGWLEVYRSDPNYANANPTTNWTSDNGTVSSLGPCGQYPYGVYNASAANTGWLKLALGSLNIGLYMIEYCHGKQSNAGIHGVFVNANGTGVFTRIRGDYDCYSVTSVSLPMRDVFTITTVGACTIQWLNAGKNAASASYYVCIPGPVVVTKIT